MKLNKLLLLILFLFFAVSPVIAQASVEKATAEVIKEEIKNKPYPIDARPFLEKSENMARVISKGNPDYLKNAAKLNKAFSFTVGDAKEWWASNRLIENFNDSFYKVQSTCRAVGSNCYVFVEDSLWNVRITQTQVNAIVTGFDNSTPANASKGIYQTDTETFGDPPNIDGDAKVIILVLNIIDDFDPAAGNYGYVGGYFHGWNEYSNSDLVAVPGENYPATSNEAEMFYIDANPADMLSEPGINEALNTVAHEFQHMIHYNINMYNDTEYSFINEGCSEMASYICGYGFRSQGDYSNATTGALLSWNSTLSDYSRAARFMLYMHEQFGPGFLHALVQEKKIGGPGIDAAIKTMGGTLAYREVIQNFHIANAVNDKSVDSKYGYDLETIQPVNFTQFYTPTQSGTVNIDKLGAMYLNFKDGKNLTAKISLNPGEASWNASMIKADVVKIGSTVTVEKGMTTGEDVDFSGFGTDYNEIIFIVRNELNIASDDTDLDVDYNTTGEMESGILELAYDVNPPTGVYDWGANDTVCVVFDGVPGAKLDSIKVALRLEGPMKGWIHRYTGAVRPTPLGELLAGEFVANSTVKPSYPYPEPWNNWVKVDLTSEDIDASTSFVADFLIEGSYGEGNNRIMSTLQTLLKSYTYWSGASGGANWYSITGNEAGDYVAYLIRAYVSFTTGTGDREVVELTPAVFKLDQNYPNPFNPATTISYTIPEPTNVKLEIFDIKGEKIAELVNDFQNAGNYQATWNGKSFTGAQVASGIYFYRVTAGNVVESKKMMLLK